MEIGSGNLVTTRELAGGKASPGTTSPAPEATGAPGDPFAMLLALLGPTPATAALAGAAPADTGGGEGGGEPTGQGATTPDPDGGAGLLRGLLGGTLVAGGGRPGRPVVADPRFLAGDQIHGSAADRADPGARPVVAPGAGPDPRPIGGIPGGLGTTPPGSAPAGDGAGKPVPPGATPVHHPDAPPAPISDPAPPAPGDTRQPTTGNAAPMGPDGRPVAPRGWLGVSAPTDGDPSSRPLSGTSTAAPDVVAPGEPPTPGEPGDIQARQAAEAPTGPPAAASSGQSGAAAPVTDPTAAVVAGLHTTVGGSPGTIAQSGGLPAGLTTGGRPGDAPEAGGSRYAAEPAHIRAQVVRQLAAESTAPGQARSLTLQLEPEHLGKVEVRIRATDDGLEVVFRAESAAAQDALRDRSGELARALGAADARWQKVEVKVSEPSSGSSDPEESDEDGSEDQPRHDQQDSRDRRQGDGR